MDIDKYWTTKTKYDFLLVTTENFTRMTVNMSHKYYFNFKIVHRIVYQHTSFDLLKSITEKCSFLLKHGHVVIEKLVEILLSLPMGKQKPIT